MEIFILAIQARVLVVVGIAWIGIGMWLGIDPMVVAWRAALAALITMVVTGMLLRVGARAIAARLVADNLDRTPSGGEVTT